MTIDVRNEGFDKNQDFQKNAYENDRRSIEIQDLKKEGRQKIQAVEAAEVIGAVVVEVVRSLVIENMATRNSEIRNLEIRNTVIRNMTIRSRVIRAMEILKYGDKKICV